jgi:hypothetical protein
VMATNHRIDTRIWAPPTLNMVDANSFLAEAKPGLEFTPVLAGGDSGAPVLDGQGRVVGVVFATNSTLACASATSELRALMARDTPQCHGN